jgi:hypothetical protein
MEDKPATIGDLVADGTLISSNAEPTHRYNPETKKIEPIVAQKESGERNSPEAD